MATPCVSWWCGTIAAIRSTAPAVHNGATLDLPHALPSPINQTLVGPDGGMTAHSILWRFAHGSTPCAASPMLCSLSPMGHPPSSTPSQELRGSRKPARTISALPRYVTPHVIVLPVGHSPGRLRRRHGRVNHGDGLSLAARPTTSSGPNGCLVEASGTA